MKTKKYIFIYICLAFIFSSCLKDEDYKLSQIDYIPEQLNDGWQIDVPLNVGMNPSVLDEIYSRLYSDTEFELMKSLLIIKDGKLISEGYCVNKEDRDKIANIKSATKSVTSLLFGIAKDLNYFVTIDQKIHEFIPEYFDDNASKKEISIHNVLTMSSGLKWSNTTDTWPLITGKYDSSLEQVLSKDMEFSPGENFRYHDGNCQLISGIITGSTGLSLEEFAENTLFSDLEINEHYWEKHPDGLNFGAVALYLKPRDFAKIGLMVLQEGVYKDTRIVSSNWIDDATKTHIYADDDHPYGYYWWIRPEFKAYTAIGHGGQYLYIIPEHQLLIVATSEPYALQYDGFESLFEFEEKIIKPLIQNLLF